MVREIRIYVEGGGDKSRTRRNFRRGFSFFLKDLRNIAREKRIKWDMIVCGPRHNTYENYNRAITHSHKDALNILLVDSENPVEEAPWEHLKTHDRWDLNISHDEKCHLMVQCMESWIITDVELLKDFYGHNFNENSLPDNPHVEEINKSDIETSLKNATRNSQKGEYHKINHGPKILERLNVTCVRETAPHCDRLFTTLTEKMSEPS